MTGHVDRSRSELRARAALRRSACGVVLLVLVALWSARGDAQDARPAPTRVVLVVRSELDRALVERVRGQASDLAVELIAAVRTDGGSDALSARARESEDAAQEQGAKHALWLVQSPGQGTELSVYVSEVGQVPVLVRKLRVEAALGSGSLETAALVVRSALRAIADGEAARARAEASTVSPGSSRGDAGHAGVVPARVQARAESAGPVQASEAAQRVAESEPPTFVTDAGPRRVESSEPEAATESESTSEPTPSDSAAAVRLFAGWQAAADGAIAGAQHGVAARVALDFGRLELAAALAVSVPRSRSDALSEISLARHSALGQAGTSVQLSHSRLAFGASVGVVAFQRWTAARSERLRASGVGFSTALAIGPYCEWAWQPGAFGAALQLGFEVVPNPPHFVYAGDAAPPIERPWLVQPRAALGLVVQP